MDRIDGPGMIQGDRLSKRLVDYLQRQEARLTTNVTLTTTINETVNASGSSGSTGEQLLAAMYGTNGVQVLGSIETGVEIRGPGTSGGGSTAWSGFMPTLIADDESLVVPANTQALFSLPITVDGVLEIDGFLVEVS
jgi:hypothetical protein